MLARDCPAGYADGLKEDQWERATVFEKLLNSVFYLSDLFDRQRRTRDPILAEKMARERRMVIAMVAALGCFLLVFAFGPVAPLQAPRTTAEVAGVVRTGASLIFAAGGGLALIWSAIELVSYWRFLRRLGLD